MEPDNAVEESFDHRCSAIRMAERNEVRELREPVHHYQDH
jgi:hypothetical protein